MNFNLSYILIFSLFSFLILGCNNSRRTISENDYLFSNTDEEIAHHKMILSSDDWRLIEVNGQPVDSVNGQIPYIQFEAEAGRISGTAGCNRFYSNFKISKGNRISFSEVLSTKMACVDMSVEDRLFPILAEADNYNLNEYEFNLNKAKMAPLAKFVRMNKK